MVRLRLVLDAEVAIQVNGQDAIETEVPFPGAPAHDAPTSSYRLLEVEEHAPFSVNITLGMGFRQLVDPIDRGLLIIVEMDGLEVLRRLITRRGFKDTDAPSLRLSYHGVLDWTAGETSRLRKFQFKGLADGNHPAKGTIRVELFFVKLLGHPERDELADTVPLEGLFRGIR